ncbi:hypothetical protein PV405_35665, partial [Streptomyces sp. ME02-6979-3A]|uniref:hypothetical protein n=1 Tax=Streptomyces sp. ME02-6979-3A TaxID=3028673 RepID=UPI0029AF1BCC
MHLGEEVVPRVLVRAWVPTGVHVAAYAFEEAGEVGGVRGESDALGGVDEVDAVVAAVQVEGAVRGGAEG